MGLVFFGLDKREIYNLFQEFHVFTLAKFLKVIIVKPGLSKNALEMSCLCLSCNSLECHPSLHSPISSLKKREKIGYYTMARWE